MIKRKWSVPNNETVKRELGGEKETWEQIYVIEIKNLLPLLILSFGRLRIELLIDQ